MRSENQNILFSGFPLKIRVPTVIGDASTLGLISGDLFPMDDQIIPNPGYKVHHRKIKPVEKVFFLPENPWLDSAASFSGEAKCAFCTYFCFRVYNVLRIEGLTLERSIS